MIRGTGRGRKVYLSERPPKEDGARSVTSSFVAFPEPEPTVVVYPGYYTPKDPPVNSHT